MKTLNIKKENTSAELSKEKQEQKEITIQNEAFCSPEFSEGCIFNE